jgi:hypothetical protein
MKLKKINEAIDNFLYDKYLTIEQKPNYLDNQCYSIDLTFTEKNNIFRLIHRIKFFIQSFIDILGGKNKNETK